MLLTVTSSQSHLDTLYYRMHFNIIRRRNSKICIVTMLQTGGIVVDYRQKQEIFIFHKTSRVILETIRFPI